MQKVANIIADFQDPSELYQTIFWQMKRSDIPDLISFLLILMFGYAAISKVMDLRLYRVEMLRQPLPTWSVPFLVFILPLSEILTAICLFFKKTQSIGLYAASSLMVVFTLYIGLAMTGAFGNVPCSCGGVIGKLTWPQHFAFNLVFLAISIYGIIIDLKERRFIGK